MLSTGKYLQMEYSSRLMSIYINSVLADKFGNLNTFIIAMTVATITVLIEWVFAYTFTDLIVFAVIHGLVFGSYFSICKCLEAIITFTLSG